MTEDPRSPGPGAQRLARVLEYYLLCLLLVLPIPIYLLHGHRSGLVVVLHVGLVLPLFWRRRSPELAFATIAAVAFVQWVVYEPIPSDVTLLMALYTIAATGPIRETVFAALVLEFGILLVSIDHRGITAKVVGFIFLSGLTTAAAVLGTNIATRRAYLREIEERADRLEAERDQKAKLAVAAERARVAREMHDIVAHNLAVMVALTDGASLTLRTNPDRAETALAEASQAGRTALNDMRRVLGILRDDDSAPTREVMPHLSALDQLVETVRHTGLDVRYRTTGPIQALPEALQLSIYRIVQEALTNVMKHAHGARVVTVDVTVTEDEAVIAVQDDGKPSVPSVEGHGLVGMRERTTLHGGTMHAGPAPVGWRAESRLLIHRTDEGPTL